MFPIPSGKNTAIGTVPTGPDQSAAETARLAAAAAAAAKKPINTRPKPRDPANQTAAVEARTGKKNTSTAGAGRGSADAYKSQLIGAAKPFIPGNSSQVNKAAATAALATGASTLLPGRPPVSNGQVVGSAFNPGPGTTPGRLNINLADQALFRNNPQKGARDN